MINYPGFLDVKTCGHENTARPLLAAAALTIAVIALAPPAEADEGGVSFWVPGFFGSLAPTPQQPGSFLATVYYHTSVSAGGDVGLAASSRSARSP